MEIYDYQTPDGYGDTFYVYAFDVGAGGGANLTPGSNALNQKISITDGSFVARWWKGVDLLGEASQGILIRDPRQNPIFSAEITPNIVGALMTPYMGTGWPILPEIEYPDSGYIGFDLFGVLP